MMSTFMLVVLAQAFTVKAVEDGVEVSWRPVPGSGFSELRFVGESAGDVETLCTKAFGTGKFDPDEPHLVSRALISDTGDERVTWDEIAPPMVSRRDYVMRSVRTRTAGKCRIDFAAFDDPAHPARDGVVRLSALRGSFTFEAVGARVRVEHRVHMDPGGLLAPFVVEGSRERMSLAWMKRLLLK